MDCTALSIAIKIVIGIDSEFCMAALRKEGSVSVALGSYFPYPCKTEGLWKNLTDLLFQTNNWSCPLSNEKCNAKVSWKSLGV